MLQAVSHATGGGVNHDLFADEVEVRSRNFPRVLTGLGLCGSTAAFDCEVKLLVNGLKMGTFRNLAAGGPTKDHILKTAIPVPANATLECLVIIDSTANPFLFLLEFVP